LGPLGFSQQISQLKPIEFSSLDLPITYNQRHGGNAYYKYLKEMIAKYQPNLANELLTWCTKSCKDNALAVRHIRTSLVLIGYEMFFSKRPMVNFTHYDSFMEQLRSAIHLTQNEAIILRALYIPTDANRKYNINQEDILLNGRFKIREDFRIAVNSMAIIFGMGKASFLYKYLFDIRSIHQSHEISFGTQISNNMDCQSQFTMENGTTIYSEYRPCSQPQNLSRNTYTMVQLMFFSSLAFQVYYISGAYNCYKDALSSSVPREGEKGAEEGLTEEQKVRNFLWRKYDVPLMSFAGGKSKDQYFKQATSFIAALYDNIGINREYDLLTNPNSTSASPVPCEQLLERLFQSLDSQQDNLVVDTTSIQTDQFIQKLTSLYSITEIPHMASFLDIKTEFDKFYANQLYLKQEMTFQNILFYTKKSNLFKFSKLLPYCVEFYNWIMNTWNGLIKNEDLDRPVYDLIVRYKKVFNRHSHIDETLLEIVRLWNNLLEVSAVGYQCNANAVRPIEDAKQVTVRLFVDEDSYFRAVIKYLLTLHNQDMPESAEEVPFELVSLQHPASFPNISQETFVRIAMMSVNSDDGQYDWPTIEKNLSEYLGGRKFKIGEIPMGAFHVRVNDQTIINDTYEVRMKKQVEKMKEKYAEEVKEVDKATIVGRVRTFDTTQYMAHMDELAKIYEQTLDLDIYTSDELLRSIVASDNVIETILDTNLGQLGSIMEILFENFSSKEYVYCQISGLREPLTSQQVEHVRLAKLTQEEHNTLKSLLETGSFSSMSNPHIQDSREQKLLEYVKAILMPDEDEEALLEKVLDDSILIDQYVELHKLLNSLVVDGDTRTVIEWMTWDDSLFESETTTTTPTITIQEEAKSEESLWFEFNSSIEKEETVINIETALETLDAIPSKEVANENSKNYSQVQPELMEEELEFIEEKSTVPTIVPTTERSLCEYLTTNKPSNISEEKWNIIVRYLEEQEYDFDSVTDLSEQELLDLGFMKGPIKNILKFLKSINK